MPLLTNGPDRHEHDLPDPEGLREGALALCPGCNRYFVLDPIPWERTWVSVRWWNRQARRRIAERMGQ